LRRRHSDGENDDASMMQEPIGLQDAEELTDDEDEGTEEL
jgi:hypothetical protein